MKMVNMTEETWRHLIHKKILCEDDNTIPKSSIQTKSKIQKKKKETNTHKNMSVTTTSIPSIRFSPSSSSPSPSSSSSSPSSSSLRFSVPKSLILTIRSSQADGPIRRPVAPSLIKPPTPPSLTPPTPPSAPQKPAVAAPAVVTEGGKNVITLEFQRQKAKEIQEYFKQKKIEEANQGPFFGFIAKNEISNGRWAMFGFAVGLLTEYATGSDFVEQVKLIVSNLGIVDLE